MGCKVRFKSTGVYCTCCVLASGRTQGSIAALMRTEAGSVDAFDLLEKARSRYKEE